MIDLVWICPDCNTELERPVDNKCVNGHPLWSRHIWAPTRQQSFPAAFITALLVSGLCFAVALALHNFIPATFGPNTLPLATAGLAIVGLDGLWHAASWAGKGGSVRKLSSRAAGMGLGCLAAAAAGLAYLTRA